MSDVCELFIGGAIVVLSIRRLVVVVLGIAVDAKSFGVEDCLHASYTRTIRVSWKVMG